MAEKQNQIQHPFITFSIEYVAQRKIGRQPFKPPLLVAQEFPEDASMNVKGHIVISVKSLNWHFYLKTNIYENS